ncbi:hypothetical protein ACS370_004425 [Pseudomonas aeruginosa]
MTTQARAQERIKRIGDAKSERDADHFESEAMCNGLHLKTAGLAIISISSSD